MITLAKKIKEERDKKEKGDHGTGNTKSGRTSIRDKLLTKGRIQKLLRSLFMYTFCAIKLLN